MKSALIFSAWIVFSAGLARAEAPVRMRIKAKAKVEAAVAGPNPWITFQNLHDRQSFACDAILGRAPQAGARKDNLQVLRELSIPREQVNNLIAAAPPAPADPPNVPQSFLSRLKAMLAPAPAPVATPAPPSSEMNVLIDNLRAPQITPAAREVLERVADRMADIQREALNPGEAIPVRHLKRGRLNIQRYLSGLVAQTKMLQDHVRGQAAAHALNVIPEVEAAVPVEALATFKRDDARPLLKTRWSEFKDTARIGFAGAHAGFLFISLFHMNLLTSVPLNLAVGAGLYYVSETFRDQVGFVVGGVKSLYQSLRAVPPAPAPAPPPTEAELFEQRLDRLQIQANVYQQMVEHLSGKKPKQGFSYFAFEAESAGQMRLIEHILYTDMKNYALFTIISNVKTGAVSFTRVDLP